MKPRKVKPIVWLCVFALWLCAGCASMQTASGRVLATSAVTVDATMRAWAQYVVAANPPAEDEAAVRRAYENYQSALKVAADAWIAASTSGDQSGYEAALLSLAANEDHIVNLVRSLTKR